MNTQTTTPTGPLAGLLVLDLSHALAGPHAAMMLGDLGARVIKVEPPGGDETRGWGPPFARPPDPAASPESTYFLSCNRNKESITADLKTDHGRDLVERLIRRADVLVENFRPGVLDRLHLGPERLRELNPTLIVLSISGFGHDGPQGGRPGYDQIAQGEAGLMSLTGEPGTPTKTGVPIADLLAGIFGVCATLAALIDRQKTGSGRTVRTSLLSAIVGIHSFQGTRWTVAGQTPEATGNQHPAIAPYGLFHCADADIQIAAGSQPLWRALATTVGINPDDPHYATNADRVRHRTQLQAALQTRLAQQKADHWLDRLSKAGIPAGRIRTLAEVYTWDQTRHQNLTTTVNHPTLGPITLPAPPWHFDNQPPTHHTPPPTLGQHNTPIRAWLSTLDEHLAPQPAAPTAEHPAATHSPADAAAHAQPTAPPPSATAPPTAAPPPPATAHPAASAIAHAPTTATPLSPAAAPPTIAHPATSAATHAQTAAAPLSPAAVPPTAAHPAASAETHAQTPATPLSPAAAHLTAEQPTSAHPAAAHPTVSAVAHAPTTAAPLSPAAAHLAASVATYAQAPAAPLLSAAAHPTAEQPTTAHPAAAHLVAEHLAAAHALTAAAAPQPAPGRPDAAHLSAAQPSAEYLAAAYLPAAYPTAAHPGAATRTRALAASLLPVAAQLHADASARTQTPAMPLLPASAHQTAEQPAVAAQLVAASPAVEHSDTSVAGHARASIDPPLPAAAHSDAAHLAIVSLAAEQLAAAHSAVAHPPAEQPVAHPAAEQPAVARSAAGHLAAAHPPAEQPAVAHSPAPGLPAPDLPAPHPASAAP
ncbi:crotonobetainyl-CoA:carnitine CoA-transferase CaiB-like acyl-CoA transferase [Catenulispora sp. GAS73]|uniref:CoA transferase n=1 Tax=Catenulispora sp. GAS73 TaxID=3156269 RepID=UPI00351802C8